MRFGSVCSGIEAASVAWGQLGWRAAWLAEIEKFPSAVLAHHYPDVPNLGDMTKLPERIRSGEIEAPDVFCGGTPCQAFSVAGMRRSLDDARGNLSLTFCTIANEIDTIRSVSGAEPCIVFWENVPGVLSTKDNAFGCFLAGLAGEDAPLEPPGGKWTNAGAVFGPARTVAWRVTDAQYFGVAQRRRRVFVVASARKGFDPCKVLFEFDGVRRDTAPSREAGEGAAGGVGAGAEVGSRHNSHWNGGAHPPLSHGAQTRGGGIGASNQEIFEQGGAGLVTAVDIRNGAMGDVTQTLQAGMEGHSPDPNGTPHALVECITGPITHTLKADGFNASEDGTGRGTPMVAALPFDTAQITSATNRSQPKAGDPCHPLAAGAHPPAIAFKTNQTGANGANWSEERTHSLSSQEQPPAIAFDSRQDPVSSSTLFGALGSSSPQAQAVAFSSKDYGADAGPISPTLRSMGHDGSHANGGGQVAVAHVTVMPTMMAGAPSSSAHRQTSGNMRDAYTVPTAAMQVRRLTPRECERLQGFPDDYTLIPFGRAVRPEKLAADWVKYLMRGGVMTLEQVARAAADGPRYKALGNSWAVPNVAWIGRRIVAELERSHEA